MNCNKCKWYKKSKSNPKRGNCYRFPPVLIQDKSSNSGKAISVRPQVDKGSYCGLWEQKD